jgi:hypothetical protein
MSTTTTSSSSSSNTQDTDLRAELNRLLLESGQLQQLETHLLSLLQEAGWTENLRLLCREKLSSPKAPREGGSVGGGGEGTGEGKEALVGNYRELLSEVRDQAMGTVPEVVRSEMLKKLGRVLSGWVE